MNQRKWKKAAGICLVIAALVFSFWYGGDAPGLQGFSIDSGESIADDGVDDEMITEEVESGTGTSSGSNAVSENGAVSGSGAVTGSDAASGKHVSSGSGAASGKDPGKQASSGGDGKSGGASSEKKGSIFQRIIMQVKKITSSKSSKNKNPQTNKKAQKNANRAAEKSGKNTLKEKEKKSADSAQNRETANGSSQSSAGKGSGSNGKKSSAHNSSGGDGTGKDSTAASENALNYDPTADSATDIAADVESEQDHSENANTEAKQENTPENEISGGTQDAGSDSGNTETAQTEASPSENGNNNAAQSETNSETIQCTIYISCASVLNHLDLLTDSTKKIIPEDGVILDTTSVKVKKDSTVFEVLEKATKENQVHLEFNYTPAYKTYYIEGIGNLYQFDAGNLSGWMYSVNGEFPGVGCSGYKVKDGDSIMWLYTCSFGKDVGGYFEESGE